MWPAALVIGADRHRLCATELIEIVVVRRELCVIIIDIRFRR